MNYLTQKRRVKLMESETVFKIGMKVVFTEKAISDNVFSEKIKEGDIAVITAMSTNKNFVDYPIELRVNWGEGERLQFIHKGYAEETYSWFKELKNGNDSEPKYFLLGDFVVLKKRVAEEVLLHQEYPKNTVGVVYGGKNSYVKVSFLNKGEDEYDYVSPEDLRLATDEEKEFLREHKVARISYNHRKTQSKNAQSSVPIEYTVKIGDIVEVTGEKERHPKGTIGEVIEILSRDGHYNRVLVRNNTGENQISLNARLIYRQSKNLNQ